ncbi:hypothetical protein [Streptomyces sp. NPDC002386]
MSVIRLRVVEFETLAESRGHDTFEKQAAATRLGAGTIHRLRSGEPASAGAVARICSAYGVQFEAVFVIDDTPAPVQPKPLRTRRARKALAA